MALVETGEAVNITDFEAISKAMAKRVSIKLNRSCTCKSMAKQIYQKASIILVTPLFHCSILPFVFIYVLYIDYICVSFFFYLPSDMPFRCRFVSFSVEGAEAFVYRYFFFIFFYWGVG